MTNVINILFLSLQFCFVFNFVQSNTLDYQHGPPKNLTNIIFPSVDTNKNHDSNHQRLPLTNISCHNSELLYPGDNEGDWVCDCKPGFLHYPITGECYEAYTQGPCDSKSIIIIPQLSSIPECVVNRCIQKEVYFNGNCFRLNNEDGCADYKRFTGRKIMLLVDPTNLGLICADEEFMYECAGKCCKARKPKPDFKDICFDKNNATDNVRAREASRGTSRETGKTNQKQAL